MIIAVDEGYTRMKSVWGLDPSEREIYKSTVKDGYEDFTTNIRVEYNGKKYTIGSNKGNYCSNLSRINDPNAELLLFTSIGRVLQENEKNGEEVDLVVGVPSGQFDELKKAKKAALIDRNVTITINGEKIDFHIRRVIVMPQCSGIFIVEDLVGEYLAIDFGGMTIDVTELSDGQPGRKRSYALGMQTLYTKIINDINSKGEAYELYRGEEVIRDKVIITKDGEVPYDPSPIIKAHIDEAINQNIRFDFPQYDNVRKRWFGGGAVACQEELGLNVSKDTVFMNANIYFTVGSDRF